MGGAPGNGVTEGTPKKNLGIRWKNEFDQTQARLQCQSYAVMVRKAKQDYFSTLISSMEKHPATLFTVTHFLLKKIEPKAS